MAEMKIGQQQEKESFQARLVRDIIEYSEMLDRDAEEARQNCECGHEQADMAAGTRDLAEELRKLPADDPRFLRIEAREREEGRSLHEMSVTQLGIECREQSTPSADELLDDILKD